MYGVRMRERPPGMVGHHGLTTENGKQKTENRKIIKIITGTTPKDTETIRDSHQYISIASVAAVPFALEEDCRCTCANLGRHVIKSRKIKFSLKSIYQPLEVICVLRFLIPQSSTNHYMDLEHSGLQEVANAMREENANMSNTAQKRKRDSESADDTRRLNNKRVSASSGNDSGDQSLVNQQIGDVEALQNYANLQHNQQIHPDHQNGAADHANASSTAAAALAGIYPTMTIPQPTDVLSLLKHLRTIATKTRLSWITASNLTIASWTIRNSNINLKVEVLLPNQSWDLMNGTRFERTITKKLSDVAAKQSTKDQFCKELSNSSLSSRRTRLKNIEKWTLEKLLTEQAIAELSASNDKLKTECERAWREVETWKKTCQSAGLAPKKEDAGTSEKLDEVLRMLGGLLLHCWSQLR
ncbi:hypothetical protein EYC84_007006 [Monilinia fructicola]|uniref:Uncharacterized protein n=1 Tax=Monilinia fructicola TaxID=38448 RepID=A0A5M9K5R7_MONFR|nr:hypothetical protein EYC84_007006 [Monilinia fructicola]